jgi:hypothetical protein
MKGWLVPMALLWGITVAGPALAQDDYLTSGEVSAVRDAQEPDKRMILWMDLAQRRIDAVKKAVDTFKPQAGRAIQAALDEYIHIMESLDSTIQDARERRVPLDKGLKDVETRASLYLNYLRTLNSEAIPGFDDFKYTLEEALDMTRDELAEVAKGNYPEVLDRTPPSDLPSPSARPPTKADPQPEPAEEGPPRKSQQGR